jgi:hypothetical protein
MRCYTDYDEDAKLDEMKHDREFIISRGEI